MAVWMEKGGVGCSIGAEELRELVVGTVRKSGRAGGRMLLLPPDHTRLNSRAGEITRILVEEFDGAWSIDIMPALGTHSPMGPEQLELMFGDLPPSRFLVHDWRHDVVKLGTASSDFIRELSGGKLDYEVSIEVNRRLFAGYFRPHRT